MCLNRGTIGKSESTVVWFVCGPTLRQAVSLTFLGAACLGPSGVADALYTL